MMGSSASYRRCKEHVQYFTLRVPHDDMAEIRKAAKEAGSSINETILTYVSWGLEQQREGL